MTEDYEKMKCIIIDREIYKILKDVFPLDEGTPGLEVKD